MKKFSNIISENNIVNDYIDYSLLQHLAITYKLNHVYSRSRIILEKYGVYNGCEELVSFIFKEIEKGGIDNQYEFTKNELTKFDNIFFNKLIIDIDNSGNDGGEYLDNDKLNKDLLFDEVFINIYICEKDINYIKEVLMHELTHAYNNYIMLLKNDNNYLKKAKSFLYKNITDINVSNKNEFLLKQALYLFLGYEKNAFIAQLKGELNNHKEKIKRPNDALKILKNSQIYYTYKYLDDKINKYFEGKLSDNDIKEIENAYIKITKETKTANQIFKTLRSLSKKTLKKLDTQLPKMCIENLNNVLVTDDINMNKFIIDYEN